MTAIKKVLILALALLSFTAFSNDQLTRLVMENYLDELDLRISSQHGHITKNGAYFIDRSARSATLQKLVQQEPMLLTNTLGYRAKGQLDAWNFMIKNEARVIDELTKSFGQAHKLLRDYVVARDVTAASKVRTVIVQLDKKRAMLSLSPISETSLVHSRALADIMEYYHLQKKVAVDVISESAKTLLKQIAKAI